MFEIEYICEGVYDLWYHVDEFDYHGEYVGTYDSYDAAYEEMSAYEIFGDFAGRYTL